MRFYRNGYVRIGHNKIINAVRLRKRNLFAARLTVRNARNPIAAFGRNAQANRLPRFFNARARNGNVFGIYRNFAQAFRSEHGGNELFAQILLRVRFKVPAVLLSKPRAVYRKHARKRIGNLLLRPAHRIDMRLRGIRGVAVYFTQHEGHFGKVAFRDVGKIPSDIGNKIGQTRFIRVGVSRRARFRFPLHPPHAANGRKVSLRFQLTQSRLHRLQKAAIQVADHTARLPRRLLIAWRSPRALALRNACAAVWIQKGCPPRAFDDCVFALRIAQSGSDSDFRARALCAAAPIFTLPQLDGDKVGRAGICIRFVRAVIEHVVEPLRVTRVGIGRGILRVPDRVRLPADQPYVDGRTCGFRFDCGKRAARDPACHRRAKRKGGDRF